MSSIENIQNYILTFISENSGQENTEISLQTNFVEEGLLDSFSILNLIMNLESEFNVKFSPYELADPSLQVVSPLSNAVLNKISRS